MHPEKNSNIILQICLKSANFAKMTSLFNFSSSDDFLSGTRQMEEGDPAEQDLSPWQSIAMDAHGGSFSQAEHLR